MAVRKTKKGAALKRWFKEKWVDTKTGKPCGRSKGDGRGVPYCRPSKRISSKTPKTSGQIQANLPNPLQPSVNKGFRVPGFSPKVIPSQPNGVDPELDRHGPRLVSRASLDGPHQGQHRQRI